MELSQELYETPGDRLEAFVRRSLQPQGGWKDQVQDAWHRIQQFLQDQCFEDELVQDREVRVLKVVKGGSSGKGTALNHSSDLDIVLFLSCFSSFQDQAFFREEIINFIEERLEYCSRSLAYSITVAHHRDGARAPRSLFLQVQSKKSSDVIRVDLLPAFDALGTLNPDSKPAPEIYADLIHSISYPGEFSPSFTVLQRHFVKSRPVKLKNLLQLVKFWYLKSEPEWKAASATDRLYQRPQAEGERGRRCPGEQESTGEMTDRHPNCMSMLLRLFAAKHKLLFRFYTELGKANTGFQAKKLRLQSLISRAF